MNSKDTLKESFEKYTGPIFLKQLKKEEEKSKDRCNAGASPKQAQDVNT